jgi:hypothetical protein
MLTREQETSVMRFYDELSLDHRESVNFFVNMVSRLTDFEAIEIDTTNNKVHLKKL